VTSIATGELGMRTTCCSSEAATFVLAILGSCTAHTTAGTDDWIQPVSRTHFPPSAEPALKRTAAVEPEEGLIGGAPNGMCEWRRRLKAGRRQPLRQTASGCDWTGAARPVELFAWEPRREASSEGG